VTDQFVLLNSVSDDKRTVIIHDAVRDEIAAATRWSGRTTQCRIDLARLLHKSLPATMSALREGAISLGHARVIADHAMSVPEESRQALEERVLVVARRNTVSATRQAARRAVLAIDTDGARRRQVARCTRGVWVVDELDGMSTLMARMATEHAHAVLAALDATAKSDDCGETLGERRAHALAGAVLGGPLAEVGGRGAGPAVRAHLAVVIDLPTLQSLHSGREGSSGFAELLGCGPISTEAVRGLLVDSHVAVTLRRLVSDPVTGHLLDYGRRTYEVPQALRDFVVARDKHCRFPGCQRRADLCQLDHAEAWDDGGATNPANVGALCVRHHQLKTHRGWDITDSRSDGSCRWTSPQGRHYDHAPPPVLNRPSTIEPPPF
jgi:hypothetical protein